jgi:hypothetical protein
MVHRNSSCCSRSCKYTASFYLLLSNGPALLLCWPAWLEWGSIHACFVVRRGPALPAVRHSGGGGGVLPPGNSWLALGLCKAQRLSVFRLALAFHRASITLSCRTAQSGCWAWDHDRCRGSPSCVQLCMHLGGAALHRRHHMRRACLRVTWFTGSRAFSCLHAVMLQAQGEGRHLGSLHAHHTTNSDNSQHVTLICNSHVCHCFVTV